MDEKFLILYHNPRCTKSNIAMEYLEKSGKRFILFRYLEGMLKRKDIEEILKFGKMDVRELLRRNEREYLEFVRFKGLSDDEIIDLIIKYPRMLERPIILDREKRRAFIVRDEESLKKI